MVLANELCDRVRNHYLTRQGIDDPYWRQEVRSSVPFTDRKPDPDGWLHISTLSDRIAGDFSSPSHIRTRKRHSDRGGVVSQSSIAYVAYVRNALVWG
jgi:hypothetical protein